MKNTEKKLMIQKLQNAQAKQLAMYSHPSQTKQRMVIMLTFKNAIDYFRG